MGVGTVVALVVLTGLVGYLLGRHRSLASVGGDIRRLHSLPAYYGQSVFFFAVVPSFLVMLVWLLVQPPLVGSGIAGMIGEGDIPEGGSRGLVMADLRRIAFGLDAAVDAGFLAEDEVDRVAADPAATRARLAEVGVGMGENVAPSVFAAAAEYRRRDAALDRLMALSVVAIALAGAVFAYLRITPEFRARNVSENVVKALLILCSTIAIFTTAGIVLSLVFETAHFFRLYPWSEFLLSPTWNPQFRGGSELGILPLLWGTLYVSFVALLFAVPVGLFVAIYLSEYASGRLRATAKPLIEILAGIPTIVYGLFALITVGPMLRDHFATPLGLGTSSSSVMTAGLVMGIMLIPFVSSLSDDIINAVPQSLRDGSYAIGATQSETIRQVVLPAALPGIVGAILLAASRAIGETMIVVMGAGAAARLSMNPFEAMTTITVKIVSQLTGDTEFASPETLVAFALGLSLFVLTLALNVLALWIVRRYREQYE